MYGLERISAENGNHHAIIVLHGILQTRSDLADPFGSSLVKNAKSASVFVYGYDHTQHLETNGSRLAQTLENMGAERIDLVGYSMGGLVARLAASDRPINALHRIVTIATPNRGALGPAQLTLLGQVVRRAFHMFSPLAPRTDGVRDLTKAAEIMAARRNRIKLSESISMNLVSELSYASIPALFYHPDRDQFTFGPSIQLSLVQGLFLATKMKKQLEAMARPHDGIVTEDSCNISKKSSHDWSEVHLAKAGKNGEPALCHAVFDTCIEHDHSSIITKGATEIAKLVWLLLSTKDWRELKNDDNLKAFARFDLN